MNQPIGTRLDTLESGQGSAPPPEFALLAPAEAPVLIRSSPHVMSFDAFGRLFGGSARRVEMLTALRGELQFLRDHGIEPLCLLAGGSFVRSGAAPNDFDALVVYALASTAGPDAIGLLRHRATGDLDLRFVPGDAGPIPLIKMSCFFHTLYQSLNRDGGQACFIVTLDAM